MYALRPIQNCMSGKRRRDNVDTNIPEEPPAKRHHQRHLTSPPPKRGTVLAAMALSRNESAVSAVGSVHSGALTLLEVGLRGRDWDWDWIGSWDGSGTCCDGPSGALSAPNPVPIPTPPTKPNLRKRQRTAEDAGVSEVEPKAKRHHQRHLTSRPTKHIARNSSKPAIPTQTRYSLRMTPDLIRRNIAASPSAAPVTDPIPAPVSIPSLIQVSVPVLTPAAIPDPTAPSDRAATSSCIQDRSVPIQITRVLNPVIAPISDPTLVPPSTSIPSRCSVNPASTLSKPTHLPWSQLPEVTQTRLSAQYDDLVTRTWGSQHRLWGDSWPGYFEALGLSTCQKPIGIPEDNVFKMFPDLDDAMFVAHGKCNFYDLCHHHVFSNDLDTSINEALAQVETWFLQKRLCEVEGLRPHTLDLLRKVSAHWGFYFAYSPNKTAEEARASKLSHDLILATQELGASMDTATYNHKATSHHAALAQHCFYALYLTRIIALQRFLDCLPRDMDAELARSEWALFQYDPPRLPDGDDIFSAIYRRVTRACGSVFDLKRAAEARFRALVKKDRQFFLKKREHPLVIFAASYQLPFYLAVDEVEEPVLQSPSSGRRPACSRLGVNALFYGFDAPP
ncbi:uncharacterized protein STEHIDRAFT_158163 [Stereum hirsutum FP-91666 SS1]|uniref:uncharacterized protein n=1 Tax=Stereum hirsutum (strain FP-91666) TaxID=721885 RepID=UPI000444A3BC|nr:uncharacterized protein STEHIDRAFT_158163 [Stereum hirsutum FP-91666 SS1]EIM85534.1 hypothetical protein STEHIDRAFT_158163 [Stereum hirsutum FP-91666 SS1]